jgi:uncharacterized protein YdhG (YjbR/CyaY superfamily)
MTTVDDYIASAPSDVQPVLHEIRRRMHRAVPGAGETISYGIPTITLDDSYLVYFAAWKRHISVYPIPETDDPVTEELAPYKASKGTLKFPLDRPMPYDLIELVAGRLLAQRRASGA